MLNLLAATLLTLSALASAEDTCYRRTNYQIVEQNSGWFACNNTGSNGLCCINGSQCGPDGICRRSDTGVTGDESRWYIGGCTDKRYKDPACKKYCSGDKQTWITWDSSKDRWSCCGNDGCDEGKPTDEHFIAVSPSQWASGGGSSTTPDAQDGLSMGEKIGIAVGIGIVGMGLVVSGLIFWRMRNKKSRQTYGGVKGRYEELSIPARAGSPQPPRSRVLEPETSYHGAVSPQPSREPSPAPKSRNAYSDEPSAGRSADVPDTLNLLPRDKL